MRLTRGVVNVPIPYVYLLVVVLFTAAYIYLMLSAYRARKNLPLCDVNEDMTKSSSQKRIVDKQKLELEHPGCHKVPIVNSFDTCPHCFRPNIMKLWSRISAFEYGSTLFQWTPPGIFTPRGEVQQELIRKYLITPSSVCTATCPYLVAVAIQSSVTDGFAERNTIRATWGSAAKTRVWPYADMNADFQIIFVLAHTASLRHGNTVIENHQDNTNFSSSREWAELKAEADIHGDILYLDMPDTYHNRTLKVMSAFKWAKDHCTKTKFFMKLDMNSFVNVPLLLDLLIYNEERLEFALMGNLILKEITVGSSQASSAKYPLYASGSGYVVSTTLLSRWLKISPFVPMGVSLNISHVSKASGEEIFVTGVLAFVISCDIFDARKFFTHHTDLNWKWCDMMHDQKVIATLDTEDDIYNLWRSFYRFYGGCWKDDPELPF